ncbi:MAG: TRAP transporter small permease [Pseudomonadota bacterium]
MTIVLRRLQQAGVLLLGLALLAMVLLNVANAGGRYLFGQSISGADEILLFSMIWLVFLGTILVTAKRRHLRLDLLERLWPARGRLLQRSLIDLLLAGLCGFLALQSLAVVERLGMIGQTSMAAGLPMAWVHGGLLLGLALTALVAGLQGLLGVYQLLRGGEADEPA